MWNKETVLPSTTLTLCQPWQLPANFFGVSDCDVSLNYKSDTPTHHIALYTLNVLTTNFKDLFTELKLFGEINNVLPFVLSDMSIISYFKIKDAQEAIEFINKKYATIFKACYAKSCLLKERLDDRFFVSVTLKDNKKSNYMEHLLNIGSIYSISDTSVSFNQRILMIEYDDNRASKALFKKLNNVTIDEIKYQVYKSDNDHSLCVCNSKPPPVNNNAIKRLYSKLSQKQFDKVQDSNFSYFSVNPFSSDSASSSSSAPITPSLITSPTNAGSVDVDKKDSSYKSKNKSKDKPSNELDLKKISSGKDRRTTFMIRNIPNKYTQKMLIDSLNKTHANKYDFVYLRMDFKNKCNVGYAFINFIDPKSVVSFAEQRDGKRWELFKSTKKCSLFYATIQGKDALVRKFKSSPVMDEEEAFKPKLFYSSGPNKGKEQPFLKKTTPHTRSRNNKYYHKH